MRAGEIWAYHSGNEVRIVKTYTNTQLVDIEYIKIVDKGKTILKIGEIGKRRAPPLKLVRGCFHEYIELVKP